jgi:hypothetical protein
MLQKKRSTKPPRSSKAFAKKPRNSNTPDQKSTQSHEPIPPLSSSRRTFGPGGCSTCGPHFCSMKIAEEVRRFAARQQISEEQALLVGLEQKLGSPSRKAASFTSGEIDIFD